MSHQLLFALCKSRISRNLAHHLTVETKQGFLLALPFLHDISSKNETKTYYRPNVLLSLDILHHIISVILNVKIKNEVCHRHFFYNSFTSYIFFNKIGKSLRFSNAFHCIHVQLHGLSRNVPDDHFLFFCMLECLKIFLKEVRKSFFIERMTK